VLSVKLAPVRLADDGHFVSGWMPKSPFFYALADEVNLQNPSG
jgi:hypothetical protein